MYKAILFDMDGTLLPGENKKEFINTYLGEMTKFVSPYVDGKIFMNAMNKATIAMSNNDGKFTNEQVFLKNFLSLIDVDPEILLPVLDEFYQTRFNEFSYLCGYDALCKQFVDQLVEKQYKVVVATNPMLPEVANQYRLQWAGVDQCLWTWMTSYHNSSYTKPHPEYFREIARKINVQPEECLIVGNEIGDDMIAATIGMDTYLITDDFSGQGIENYHGKKGTRLEFFQWVKQLPMAD